MKAILALEDGTIFEGESFGAEGEKYGEVVFNTSLAGYQEILTDPSYKGQLVTMTYPLIGNYGLNKDDVESARPYVEGFIVKECCYYPNNWRNEESLDSFLQHRGIVGIAGIDTRALTKRIRTVGALRGVISTIDPNKSNLIEKVKNSPGLIGRDLVKEVTCLKPYTWTEDLFDLQTNKSRISERDTLRWHVVAYDFGIKQNILRMLVSNGCQVTVVPASTSAEMVLAMNPDGIFLSNGPGDPEGVPYAIENIRKLIGQKPIFGICLGHQILGLAFDGRTYKLKFGHHGGNHPVKNLQTTRVEITAQNHGFAVDIESLDRRVIEPTHVNLNDTTNEGMSHKELPIFSVQYHPEASPGPHDSRYLFRSFISLLEENTRN